MSTQRIFRKSKFRHNFPADQMFLNNAFEQFRRKVKGSVLVSFEIKFIWFPGLNFQFCHTSDSCPLVRLLQQFLSKHSQPRQQAFPNVATNRYGQSHRIRPARAGRHDSSHDKSHCIFNPQLPRHDFGLNPSKRTVKTRTDPFTPAICTGPDPGCGWRLARIKADPLWKGCSGR